MLLRLPDTWPQPAVAAIAMLLLAVLDLAGAFAAKEAVDRRSVLLGVVGAGLFLALFYVYACSLQYVDLALVTLGWIVILQIGVLLLDRLHYDRQISAGSWVAVVVLLAAQAYLVLNPAPAPAPGGPADAATTSVTAKAPAAAEGGQP